MVIKSPRLSNTRGLIGRVHVHLEKRARTNLSTKAVASLNLCSCNDVDELMMFKGLLKGLMINVCVFLSNGLMMVRY